MPVVKLEHVYEMMRKNDCAYWRITGTSGGRNLIDENDTEESVENGIELMQTCIEMIEDNFVCIVISDRNKKEKAKGGRNYEQFEFRVNLHKSETSTGLSGMNNGVLGLLIISMKENSELMRQVNDEQRKREMDELNRKIDELKKGDKIDKYRPYLDKLFDVDSSKQRISLAGNDDGEVNETEVQKQQRIRKALIRLNKVDSHLPDTLTLLANFAEKNPDDYKFYMQKLQKM